MRLEDVMLDGVYGVKELISMQNFSKKSSKTPS